MTNRSNQNFTHLIPHLIAAHRFLTEIDESLHESTLELMQYDDTKIDFLDAIIRTDSDLDTFTIALDLIQSEMTFDDLLNDD